MEENIAKIIAKKKRSIALKQIFKEIGRVNLPFFCFYLFKQKAYLFTKIVGKDIIYSSRGN